MKLLVAFAVNAEFAPWRERRSFCGQQGDRPRRYETRFQGSGIVVLLTGVGNPADAVARTLRREKFDACISTGLAGGLQTRYRPGEVLAARRVCREEGMQAVLSDEPLLRCAQMCGAQVVEKFCTARGLAYTTSEKSRLGLFADAVEMESFGILRAAQAGGVPGIAVRAVSDTADQDLPLDFSRTLNRRGDLDVVRLILEVGRKPWALPGLIGFARQSRRAASSLAAFLDRYVIALAGVESDCQAQVVEEVAAT